MWDKNWLESYKSEDSLNHPHRQLILEAISRYEPLESVFEVGCGAGVNLKLLHHIYPEIRLYGYDISKQAMKDAVSFFSDLPGRFLDYSDEDSFSQADILLTDAVAVYVSDKNIKSFVERFSGLAKKVLILCEWHSEEGPFIHEGHWIHNYRDLLPGCKIEKIPPEAWPESKNWQEYGRIITYETS